MNVSLTVILPIHNAEASLRRNVMQMLEVAADMTSQFEILVFDDGSTDDSYDIASELAAEFPQVQVGRHSRRRGMGATLRNARRRVTGELVIVHDGVTRVNAEDLAAVWRAYLAGEETTAVTIEDLRLPGRAQAAMETAHNRILGFRPLQPLDEQHEGSQGEKTPVGIGSIPHLPRPNFLGAIGDFALGE